jgi:hypothetical protein
VRLLEDEMRLAKQNIPMVAGKNWVDFSTRTDDIISLEQSYPTKCSEVEAQNDLRDYLVQLGYHICRSAKDPQDNTYDTATLFHLFEHFLAPIQKLKIVASKLKEGGKITVEIPQAKDAPIHHFRLYNYRNLIFWRNRLILQTRKSLQSSIHVAKRIIASPEDSQRYPLANHWIWLSMARGKPGRHIEWPFFAKSIAGQRLFKCDGSSKQTHVTMQPLGKVRIKFPFFGKRWTKNLHTQRNEA